MLCVCVSVCVVVCECERENVCEVYKATTTEILFI